MDPLEGLEEAANRGEGINFIPCLAWVKRGVTKSVPDKVKLTQKELTAVIEQTRVAIEELEADEEEEDGKNKNTSCDNKEEIRVDEADVMEKYELNDYDENEDETCNNGFGIGNLVTFAKPEDDPYFSRAGAEQDDASDVEDFKIKPTDNLILCGHVEGDASLLEVYVYNDVEDALYVHHDVVLSSFPLTLEWMNFERSGEEATKGNLVAIGSMIPVIDVWDLDLVDSLEPEFSLGKKKKKKVKGYGHTDAVLSLAWNGQAEHVLASGSVDEAVHIWDLHTGKIASTLTAHREKIQALQWHPFEAQNLLSGCCDKIVRLFDCSSNDTFKKYKVDEAVEKVLWNHFNLFTFLVGTDEGSVQMFDARQEEKPLWTLKAHSGSLNGMSLSSQCPDCFVTCSSDKTVKVWDIRDNKPACVQEQEMKVGMVHSLAGCPDAPFVTVIGGDKPTNNLKVFDIREWSSVRSRFGGRKLSNPLKYAPFGHDTANDAEPANDYEMVEQREQVKAKETTKQLKVESRPGGAAGMFRKKEKERRKRDF